VSVKFTEEQKLGCRQCCGSASSILRIRIQPSYVISAHLDPDLHSQYVMYWIQTTEFRIRIHKTGLPFKILSLGCGSVPLTDGSGSARPKNLRIRIRNSGCKYVYVLLYFVCFKFVQMFGVFPHANSMHVNTNFEKILYQPRISDNFKISLLQAYFTG
jgi:hypothetical protein